MGQARDLMDRATQAIFTKDWDALRALYAADVVVTGPDVGTLHGVDQLVDYMKQFAEALPDMTYAMTRTLETDTCAIDQGDVIGTNTGPIALPDGSTIQPTGKQVRMRSIDVATVDNGLISQHDFYFDQLELLTQLGLMEAPVAHA